MSCINKFSIKKKSENPTLLAVQNSAKNSENLIRVSKASFAFNLIGSGSSRREAAFFKISRNVHT